MNTKIVLTIISILIIMAIAWLLNEWNHRDIRMWKHTPARHLALAVKQQNTTKIATIAKAHPEVLNDQEQQTGLTLLIWSVGMEKYKSAEALLLYGADPNIARTHAGETALYVAAGYSWVDRQAKKDPKYVKLLLKYGADPNINYVGVKFTDGSRDITESGTSPLMNSIGCGIEKTKALVEGGADINYKTASGRTAAVKALIVGSLNATDDLREYAYYLIAVKKAKITDPYYRGEQFAGNDQYPNDKFYPVDKIGRAHV